jgi:hypothetical protein
MQQIMNRNLAKVKKHIDNVDVHAIGPTDGKLSNYSLQVFIVAADTTISQLRGIVAVQCVIGDTELDLQNIEKAIQNQAYLISARARGVLSRRYDCK